MAEMPEKTMRVRIEQVGAAAFEATGESGGRATVDGPPESGGEGRGMRPMEMLLSALATCSALDVVKILRQQKEPLEHLSIDIEGVRADATPSPFLRMKIVFVAKGPVDEKKLQRAVSLSVDKYCSVRATLGSAVEVTWEARRES
jgi:putative redox protein